ncbi:MAG TPA: hypothetical protein VFU11_05105 [Solirubrobacterales bacterium]|nr:hypothetical protein [Solirubrobacterales bacterium]
MADRVFHAAGYMNHRFPTVAKRVVPRDDLVAVGTFVPVKGRIIPTGRNSEQEIARWLGVEDFDPGELKLGGGGAAGSQGGSDAGFTLTDWRAKYDHCPDCGGLPDDPQQTPEEGEVVGDLCTHPIHDSVAGDEGDLGVRR